MLSKNPINAQSNLEYDNLKAPPRYNTLEDADFEIYGRAGKHPTKMKNVSKSGAFFESIDSGVLPIKKTDLLRLAIYLPSIKKIRYMDCEVVWLKDSYFGVQFITKEELQEKLLALLNNPESGSDNLNFS